MHAMDVCYICGYHGITGIAHTRPSNATTGNNTTTSKGPCFPSLLLVPPAASSKPPSPVDGHVRVCLLCSRLLLEQWKSYEKRKTPLSNRQYWFKCSSNRDSFDSPVAQRLSNDRHSTTDIDPLDRSHSVSPNTVSEEPHSAGFNHLPTSLFEQHAGQESRRIAAASALLAGGNTNGSATDSKNDTPSKLSCIVCARDIEAMDVCRQLPAHLVAQVIDLKPTLAQGVERKVTIGNLTGETVVCDECFASPSFQSAWMECCRRGSSSMQSTPSACIPQLQMPFSKTEHHEQTGLGNSASATPMLRTADFGIPNMQNLTEAQRQWFALYERALQFHFTGQLDSALLGQYQQLAAAEALASLQHSGSGEGTDR